MLDNTSLPRTGACLLVALAFATGGCGDETGILVEVTRDEATTTAHIDELRFFIGTSAGNAVFVADRDPLETVEMPGGRDLLSDPYKLLLRDGSDPGADPDRPTSIMVAVVGYEGGQIAAFGHFDSAKTFQPGKVLRWQVVLEGAVDVPVTDTGCVVLDGGKIAPADDQDCDGVSPPDDCNDLDPTIGPGAQEICDNGVDDNCNMVTDEEVDADEDGFTNCEECDDGNELVNPNAQETCDGLDNDCNGTCDVEFDGDGDGFSVCGSLVKDGGLECELPSAELIDCNDELSSTNPEADELCDGIDNDCNEICDDEWDPDEDTFTECGSRVDKCLGTNPEDVDCDPEDGDIHPLAPERCNGVDDNCDGLRYPDSAPCYGMDTTTEGADVCVVGVRTCADHDGGDGWGDCLTEGRADDPSFHAPPELCSAYDACDTADAPDPFECAGGMAAAATVNCTVHIAAPLVPTLCPSTYAPVPVPDKTGCLWTILGGKIQRHFEVGLGFFENADTPPIGAGSRVLDSCSAWFQVVSALDAPPVHDSVLLWHRDSVDTAGVLVRVNLEPAPAEPCPEVGLDCGAFPTLGGP